MFILITNCFTASITRRPPPDRNMGDVANQLIIKGPVEAGKNMTKILRRLTVYFQI